MCLFWIFTMLCRAGSMQSAKEEFRFDFQRSKQYTSLGEDACSQMHCFWSPAICSLPRLFHTWKLTRSLCSDHNWSKRWRCSAIKSQARSDGTNSRQEGGTHHSEGSWGRAVPEGKLMRWPSLSFRRLLLNLPFLFLTLGFSWFSWKMRMLSSRSSTSISRAASCCSRRRSSSSCDFCCRAARVSSSSRERSSCRRDRGQDHGHCRPPGASPQPGQARLDPSSPGAHTGSIWQFWGVSASFWGWGWGGRMAYLIHGSYLYGEGNGTPLQYSCLENPMDGGAWWAAVHGVAQSQAWLKQLSSRSSFVLGAISIIKYGVLSLTRCTVW